MAEYQHYVRFTHSVGEGILPTLECAAPEDASCRFYPDNMEAWTEEERLAHGRPQAECLFAYWFQTNLCGELCGPDGETVRNGPVQIFWTGDCMEWEYAGHTIADDMAKRAAALADIEGDQS